MALTIGQPAPAFSVPNQQGDVVTLDSLKGQWVVVYFYPKDDTPGCTIEACEFTSDLEQFNALGCKVFGVSADSPESHQAFIAKFNLTFDLLADEDKTMLNAFGVWGEKERNGVKSMGIKRETFLIDPDGKLAAHWPAVKPEGHAAEVHAKLTELQG